MNPQQSPIGYSTAPTVDFLPLSDTDGRLVLLPRATVEALQARQVDKLTLTVPIPRPEPTLTIAEAARLHVEDIDGQTFDQARARVHYAVNTGKLPAAGPPGARRIAMTPFKAWRLDQRELNLDRHDAPP